MFDSTLHKAREKKKKIKIFGPPWPRVLQLTVLLDEGIISPQQSYMILNISRFHDLRITPSGFQLPSSIPCYTPGSNRHWVFADFVFALIFRDKAERLDDTLAFSHYFLLSNVDFIFLWMLFFPRVCSHTAEDLLFEEIVH